MTSDRRDARSSEAPRPPPPARGVREHHHADPGRRRSRGGGKGLLGDPTAGGPVDAFGIPLARRDYPVTLPRTKKPVDAAAEARARRRAEGLQLRRLPQPEGAQGVRQAGGRVGPRHHLHDARRGVHEAAARASEFDVIFSSPEVLSKFVGAELVAAARARPDPQPREERLAGARARPPYDVGSRYTVPYTTYTTGIGWRNDKLVDLDPAELGWESFWEAERLRGRVSILDDEREALGMALLRRGELQPQHRGPGAGRARRRGPRRAAATASA